jgi:major membrane immunogen (membrane-anchored lipoprotein)
MQEIINKLKDLIIGKEAEEAKNILAGMGYIMRVSIKDGKSAMVTADFRNHRVNVNVDNGIVIDVVRMG